MLKQSRFPLTQQEQGEAQRPVGHLGDAWICGHAGRRLRLEEKKQHAALP